MRKGASETVLKICWGHPTSVAYSLSDADELSCRFGQLVNFLGVPAAVKLLPQSANRQSRMSNIPGELMQHARTVT